MSSSSEFAEKIIAGEDILSLTTDAAEGVVSSKLAFSDVLDSLEPFLTSVENEQRSNGILFLANVLEQLPADFLNSDETNIISEFFIKKLAEHFSITAHVLKGLSFIVGMENFPDSQVLNLLGNLQFNVTVQTLTQSSRISYYEILQKLLHSKETVLKSKPNDFVYAIITGMDSEGDPRNLMFLFQFIPEAYSKFPLEHLAEEAFSVLECYFPIDFTPKEGGGITRDGLARGLENCFVSSTEFGPFVFPMILEKLESTLKVAQVDSLKLLIKGLESWKISDINPHTTDLWKAFKLTLLQAGDNELVDLALKALTGLLRRYSSSALSAHESATLDQILTYVTENTHRFLSDPSFTLFLPSTKVLSGVAQSSRFCCEYVVKTVVPQLLALAENRKGHDAVLRALSPILTSCIYYDLWNSEETKNVLGLVPSSLITFMQDQNSQNGCFLCLKEIVPTLDDETRKNLYSATLAFLSTNDPLPEESYSTFLITLASTHPEELKQAVLERIHVADIESTIMKNKKLLSFCWCCDVPSLTTFSSDKIMHFISTPGCSSEAIICLRDFVVKEANPEILRTLGRQCDLILRLHKLCLFSVDHSNNLNDSNFDSISKIIEILMRHLTTEDQKDTCANCLALYSLDRAGEDIPPIQIELLKGLLLPLRRDVQISDRSRMVGVLVQTALKGSGLSKKSSAVLLASLVNKCQDDGVLREMLDSIHKEIDAGVNGDHSAESVELLSWIIRSLILRSHILASTWLKMLISLLGHAKISMEAANGFKIILAESPELSTVNFCSDRLLFKQWVFQWVFDDQLAALFNSEDENSRKAAALAISYVVIAVPTSLVVSQISKLIKVFVLCFESQNTEVIAATLEVLSSLLSTGEKAFDEYIDTFIPRFLGCTSSSSMVVRMNALDCIYYYGKFQEAKLIPYKNKVVLELLRSLDDPKRLVRQKAARARSRWFLVGATDDR